MTLVVWLVLFFLVVLMRILVFPVHLGLILVTWLGLNEEEQVSLWLVFVAGLVTDLLLARNLGISSFFFLWYVFFLKAISCRLQPTGLVLAVLVMIAGSVYSLLIFRLWSWWGLILSGVLTWLIYNWWPPQTDKVRKPELALD